MKHLIAMCIVLISTIGYGQEIDDAFDFLPAMHPTKQNLLNAYLEQNYLDYSKVVQTLEERAIDDDMLLSKQVYLDSIVYTELLTGNDTITHRLTFNEHKQLTTWVQNATSCYNRYSQDVPSPTLTHVAVTYNRFNKVEQISGHCATKEFRWRKNFHYNATRALDSIIAWRGFPELYTYQKIICVDTNVWLPTTQGTTVLILNTPFHYKDWIDWKRGARAQPPGYDTASHKAIENIQMRNASASHVDNNYVYAFDSLDRTVHCSALNASYHLVPIEDNYPKMASFEENPSPAHIEIQYENDKMVSVKNFAHNGQLGESMFSIGGRMRMLYRRNRLTDVEFYDAKDQLVYLWNVKKGFIEMEKWSDF